METKFRITVEILVLIISVLYLHVPAINGFNVGVRGTACSLGPDGNNPCHSLYDGECDGAHCRCPSGTHEDKKLKRCVAGAGPPKSGSDGDLDLPLDYVPGKKPEPKPKTPKPPSRPSVPQQPNVPAPEPQAPVEDPHVAEKTGGGIGGGLGILLLLGLFYFCCCRGEKGKNLRSKLPFFKKSGEEQQPGAPYKQQQPMTPLPAAV